MADTFVNVSDCHDTVCSLYSATEAFAWLSWIVRSCPLQPARQLADTARNHQTLVFLAGLLIFVVISESQKGRKSVLTDRFALSESGPLATEPKSAGADPNSVPMAQTRAEV
jgi:hypothetical protein